MCVCVQCDWIALDRLSAPSLTSTEGEVVADWPHVPPDHYHSLQGQQVDDVLLLLLIP